MRSRITQISSKAWGYLALPVALVAGPAVAILVPLLVKALVPQTLRVVLHLL